MSSGRCSFIFSSMRSGIERVHTERSAEVSILYPAKEFGSCSALTPPLYLLRRKAIVASVMS